MRIVDRNGQKVAVVDPRVTVKTVEDALDLMANAHYQWESCSLVIYKESFSEKFFDLKTRFAGEVLQKFSNYNVRLAIVGDFSEYRSKALHDFIYECNNGTRVFWKSTLESAFDVLAGSETI